jgi:hypothetical protein
MQFLELVSLGVYNAINYVFSEDLELKVNLFHLTNLLTFTTKVFFSLKHENMVRLQNLFELIFSIWNYKYSTKTIKKQFF